MIKKVTISKSIIENNKWTPKFAYIYDKLKDSPEAIEFSNFIEKGPINGIDAREYKENGKSYIRVSDMKRFFLSHSDIKKVDIKETPKKILLQENDIIISRKGTPGIAIIVTKSELNSIIGTEAILTRIKKKYDPFYLLAFLNSKMFFEQVINNLSGAVASGINHPTLKKLKILYDVNIVPEISSKVQKAIQLQESSMNLITKAQNLFYSKTNINNLKTNNEKYFSVNLSDFSDINLWTPIHLYPLYIETIEYMVNKWPSPKLSEIATIKKGNEVGSENYIEYLDKKDKDIPFIRTSDLINYEVDLYPDFYVPEEIYYDLKQDLYPGDILFSNDGKIGVTAFLLPEDKVVIQSHIKRLRLKESAIKKGITPEYLFLVLSIKEISKFQAAKYTVIQSTIPTISNYLNDFHIPILDDNTIKEITLLVKKALNAKQEKKRIMREVNKKIDHYFDN
ncbi:MAG TPA: hypothetical protein GX708_21385 [Gallicola sp.]|nr:hypothetical protein [Gallicola sp.]